MDRLLSRMLLLLAALIERRIERIFVPYVALQMIAEAAREALPTDLRDVVSAGAGAAYRTLGAATEVPARVASEGFKAEDMETPGSQQETYGLLQRRQLLVDLGQAGLLVRISQRRVGLDLVALAEQVQLADGGELCVR